MSVPAGPSVSRAAQLPTLLADAVLARLRSTLPGGDRLDVFDGEPKAEMDADGSAHPYVAFYGGAGSLASTTLGQRTDELRWQFQTTCAGGDAVRARRAIERCRLLLTDWPITIPTPDGGTRIAGWVAEVPDYDPGPLRIDKQIRPARLYTPLLWVVDAAA